MADADALGSMLQELSRFFVGAARMETTLTRVAQIGVENLDGVDFAGITMMRDGKLETSIFTDPETLDIDQAQYDADEGPCLDAFRDQAPYRIADMEAETRWPAFVRRCMDHGIGSTLSVPLQIEGEPAFGALNFYSHPTDAAPKESDELAAAFAAGASTVLANARAYWDAFELSQGLTEAMRSRAVIEQAKG